jgi:FAD dependent oxidoreductase
MSEFSVPLDSFNFAEFFLNLPPPGPASLPVPNPTKSFWTHPGLSSDWPTNSDDPEGNKYANPYASEGSETPLPAKADIVIVGSGITGVSIALELSKLVRQAKRRMDVVILEARDFCK